MGKINWGAVKYFTPDENWGDVSKINPRLVYLLNTLRDFVKKPIRIHRYAYEPRDKGQHPLGNAADMHIEDMHIMDQFFAASRFNFTGIGAYPNWNNPGLHVDCRPLEIYQPTARWMCLKAGEYLPLDWKTIQAEVL